MPASQKINYWFQKNVTKGVLLSDQHFSDKLGHAIDHLGYYHQHCGREDFKALELGSGWYPVVPIALFLNGSQEVTSIDISPLMSAKAIHESIAKYRLWRKEGKLTELEPFIREDRWSQLDKLRDANMSKSELLKTLNLNLLITDARNTGFEDSHFDLVCSNNTYEHIYPQVLKDIIHEFQRVLKPGGINSHFIDMSDHFAHLDSSISIYNFLRFSRSQWKYIDNSVQPQNRMRKKNYVELYREVGVEITESRDRKGDVDELQELDLHKDFRKYYSPQEIAVSHTHLVSTK